MFATRELDSKYVEEALLDSINEIFVYLNNHPIKKYSDLIDQKLILNICIEMDTQSFSHYTKTFLYDRTLGIFYAELKELVLKMVDLLKKSGLTFTHSFSKDFDSLNINSLIKNEKNEIKKFLNLLILFMFNCPEKNNFIDKISSFEEFQQQELIKIVERYMQIDDNMRESINRSSNYNSRRTTITNEIPVSNLNIIESEFTNKFVSKIDFLEKEKDNLEKDKINYSIKINELEGENEKLSKEKKDLIIKVKNLEENLKLSQNEKEELNKQVINLQTTLQENEESNSDIYMSADAKNKLNEALNEKIIIENEFKEFKETHEIEIKNYQEKIDLLQDKLSNSSDIKNRYEKMKEMMKDYEAIKEKNILFDSTVKELNKLKTNYFSLKEEKENLEKLVKELESNLDTNLSNFNKIQTNQEETNKNIITHNIDEPEKSHDEFLIEVLKEKDSFISNLENKIKILEQQQNHPNIELTPKDELIKQLQNEIVELKNSLNSELTKHSDDVESFKKDTFETKERYEKEFELMASSVYSLGLNYWSMKMDYAQKLSEKPNWLIKERQKYFNGDF